MFGQCTHSTAETPRLPRVSAWRAAASMLTLGKLRHRRVQTAKGAGPPAASIAMSFGISDYHV